MKRSRWKGPFLKKLSLTERLPLLPRDFEITSRMVGIIGNVHSGRALVKLTISAEMVGHKVGEFVPTRERFVFKKKKKKK